MKASIEFTCPKCGLWTPAIADLAHLPPDPHPRAMVPLVTVCHHCGENLEMRMRVDQLLACAMMEK